MIQELAESEAAPADLSVSNEGTAGTTFGGDEGSFLVNWTYIWGNYGDDRLGDDIGFARYPQTVEGEESRPPYGGIGIGVSSTSDNQEEAHPGAQVPHQPREPGPQRRADRQHAVQRGRLRRHRRSRSCSRPSSSRCSSESLETAAPRTVSPYWSDISSGIQSTWHPPSGVDQDTPEQSKTFIEEILKGESLL